MNARLRQLLAVGAFLALTFGAQSVFAASGPPASGGTPPTSQPAPAPQTNAPSSAQGGVNTLVQPPPIQGQNPPMLFEKYGPLDYAGLTTSQGLTDVNVINDEGNGEAMAEATAMYLLGIVSARIVEWCFSLNLVSQLGPTIDQFTQGLENSLYTEFLPFVVILAAIIAGWTLLVMRRFLSGLTGILWAGFTINLAVQLFVSPASYLSTADQFASGVTNAIVAGIAQEDPGAPKNSYANGDANYEVRLLANRLWTVSVYDPWTMIEFGTVDPTANGNQLGIDLLNKNDGQSNTYDKDIQAAPQWIQQWADGNWGVPRAMFGLFLVLLGGILLVFTLLIALTVIVGTLTAIVLACLTVPIWLLAPIPGFGQRLLVAWFGGIFAGLAVSTIGALYLVLVLALLGAVQQLEATVGLITVGVLDVGLIVVAFWLRKTFFRFGRHVSRLPVAAVGGQRLPAPSTQVDQKTTTRRSSHRRSSYGDHRRVAAPSSVPMARAPTVVTPASAGVGAAAAPAGVRTGAAAARAGAARGAAASAATTGGVTVATAGTALLGLAAAKVGQGAQHLQDSARRRVQAVAGQAVGAAASPARVAPVRDGRRPPPLLEASRVGQTGIRPWRGPRIDPPAANRQAGSAGHSLDATPRRLPAHSPKGRVETPTR